MTTHGHRMFFLLMLFLAALLYDHVRRSSANIKCLVAAGYG